MNAETIKWGRDAVVNVRAYNIVQEALSKVGEAFVTGQQVNSFIYLTLRADHFQPEILWRAQEVLCDEGYSMIINQLNNPAIPAIWVSMRPRCQL